MKISFLFLFCFSVQLCIGQESDTVEIKQGVFKVRKVPVIEDTLPKPIDMPFHDRFMPFNYPHGISLGYQQGKYGFAELGVWGFYDKSQRIAGIYLETDFHNTHAMMFSWSFGFLKYRQKQATLLRLGADAGAVYDVQRFDVMARPFFAFNIPGQAWLSHIQINAGYNFRLDNDDPIQTNKFFLSGRLYIP